LDQVQAKPVPAGRAKRVLLWLGGAAFKLALSSQDIEVKESDEKPIVVPSPTEAQAALDQLLASGPAKPQPWWYLAGAALFMFGFAGLVGLGSDNAVMGLAIAVIGLVLCYLSFVQYGSNRAFARAVAEGRPPPVPQQATLPAVGVAISVLPLGGAWQYFTLGDILPAILLGGFGILLGWLCVMGIVSDRKATRVAALMASYKAAAPATAAEATALATGVPPLTVRFIASRAAPDAAHSDVPTATRNCAGRPPHKILYLYNFRAGDAVYEKLVGGFGRHGPFVCLASPQDFAQGKALFGNAASTAEAEIVADAAAFDARFAALDTGLLPPGDKRLISSNNVTGGWPLSKMLCTDASWTHAVTRLLGWVDVVIIDASSYAPERSGLNWEIAHVLEYIDVSRVLVRTDDQSDLWALQRAFEAGWAGLTVRSPNARPDPAPLNILVYPGDDKQRTAEQDRFTTPDLPDPGGVLAGLGALPRLILSGQWRRACEDDRAMAIVYDAIDRAAGARSA
jgi:hypothetical protein